jgi:hypothetical protein
LDIEEEYAFEGGLVLPENVKISASQLMLLEDIVKV